MVVLIADTPQHLLRANHSKAMPGRILYLDTESWVTEKEEIEHHQLRLGWTCYVHRRGDGKKQTEIWRYWDKPSSLCHYIQSLAYRKTSLYVIGHNIFYDLQSSEFFYWFTKWGWLLEFVYEQGLTYILVIKKGKRTIKVLSSTNWFGVKLEKLGEMIGLPKGKVDFKMASDEELSFYCRRDVEIVKRVMELYYTFVTEHDCGKWSMTRAAQSLAAYRHRFMQKRIYIHKSPEALELEKDAYMGGRVECYQLGEIEGGPFLSLDVNSMYPHIMKNMELPTRLVDYRENPPLDVVKDCLKSFCCVAEVSLDTDIPLYAIRRGLKIVFPVGRFRAFVCTPCLEAALDRGDILEVHRLSVYEKGVLFKEYVDYFYSLRQQYREEGREIEAEAAKLMLNSLYGKFAQWKPTGEKVRDVTGDGYYRMETVDLVTGEVEIEYKLMNTIVRVTGREPGNKSLFAISAHITEWARYILWGIIDDIGWGKVLYCDTDSVKVRKKDLAVLSYPIDADVLGTLREEGSSNTLRIFGAKSYETDTQRKLKGVPASAIQVGQYTFQYPTFLKQRTHMRMTEDKLYLVKPTTKYVMPDYTKGTVHPDGSVTPFVLSEV